MGGAVAAVRLPVGQLSCQMQVQRSEGGRGSSTTHYPVWCNGSADLRSAVRCAIVLAALCSAMQRSCGAMRCARGGDALAPLSDLLTSGGGRATTS